MLLLGYHNSSKIQTGTKMPDTPVDPFPCLCLYSVYKMVIKHSQIRKYACLYQIEMCLNVFVITMNYTIQNVSVMVSECLTSCEPYIYLRQPLNHLTFLTTESLRIV